MSEMQPSMIITRPFVDVYRDVALYYIPGNSITVSVRGDGLDFGSMNQDLWLEYNFQLIVVLEDWAKAKNLQLNIDCLHQLEGPVDELSLYTVLPAACYECLNKTNQVNLRVCGGCGSLTDQKYQCEMCVFFAEQIDHDLQTINDLQEVQRLLDNAAIQTKINRPRKNILTSITKALELTSQIIADVRELMDACRRTRVVSESEEEQDLDSSSDLDEVEPSVVCSWCNTMIKETTSMLVSHGCCENCLSKATSEAI